MVVSHDRYFLENVARRMLELDRVYPDGLLAGRRHLQRPAGQARRGAAQPGRTTRSRSPTACAREVEWLRRGPKARTTKAKARIEEAHRLLDELAEVRERGVDRGRRHRLHRLGAQDQAAARTPAASRKSLRRQAGARGRRPADPPGTRLGVLGANGSGKTTLLALLAGKLEPDAGEIERAPFLQDRAASSRAARRSTAVVTLRRALAPEGDSVIYRGEPIHVAAWAKRFLFRAEQLDTPVARLSGGEQARILIARLMLQPADLLILDEPTNDLDIPTLEVLEESLLEFPGALVLVTHDRYLLDRVSTAILALDGRGGAQLFADTAQWEEPTARAASGRPRPGRQRKAASAGAGAEAASSQEAQLSGAAGVGRIESRILAAEDGLALPGGRRRPGGGHRRGGAAGALRGAGRRRGRGGAALRPLGRAGSQAGGRGFPQSWRTIQASMKERFLYLSSVSGLPRPDLDGGVPPHDGWAGSDVQRMADR